MGDTARIPPARRPELIVSPLGDQGQHVVKDPRTGEYFNLGPEESFLLLHLDGRQTADRGHMQVRSIRTIDRAVGEPIQCRIQRSVGSRPSRGQHGGASYQRGEQMANAER